MEYIDVHDNELGTGIIAIGDFSYNNHSFANGYDWQSSNAQLKFFCAYGNDIYKYFSKYQGGGDYQTAFSGKKFRIGNNIQGNFVYMKHYCDANAAGWVTLDFDAGISVSVNDESVYSWSCEHSRKGNASGTWDHYFTLDDQMIDLHEGDLASMSAWLDGEKNGDSTIYVYIYPFGQ